MTVLLEQFIENLCNSGLMTRAEISTVVDRVSDDQRPTNGEEMATLLYRQGRLTKFQAQAAYKGKAKGLVLGDYVILDLIGQGGMGQVYKAQHRRMKRIVALKILAANMTSSFEAVGRFQQEVEAAARLIHPNIVTAFDAGEDKNNHFLVMEFVDGRDLEMVVEKEGPLPIARAVDFILQAAQGLAYAHGQGIIHRDIKPSNLLLDNQGTIKILDMGLARIARDDEAVEVTLDRGLTQSGDVMGTVDYMSPEQAASTKHVDERTDIYSLGCTLHFLLVGRPLYDGETLVERVLAHREKPIPSLKKMRADVPQSLVNVMRRMVGKKPEFRFRSMTELIAALEKCDLPGGPSGSVKQTVVSRGKVESAKPTEQFTSQQTTPAARVTSPTSPRSSAPSNGSASSVPPPPDVTPRDRSKVHVDKTTRAKRALAQAQRAQKEEEKKKLWSNTVQDVMRHQQRKARWEKIRRIFEEGVSGLVKYVLLLAVIAGASFGSYFLWNVHQALQTSRDVVLSNVNQALERTPFAPLDEISFADTSPVKPVPSTLAFEQPLIRKPSAANGPRTNQQPPATLRGEFDRIQGVIRIAEPFRMEITIGPVP